MVEELVDFEIYPLFHQRSVFHLPDGLFISLKTRKQSVKDNLPLFVDNIWPGSKVLANYLSTHPELVRDKFVLEFGAGGALPSCAALKYQPSTIVITDYPAVGVIENIVEVIDENKLTSPNVHALGYIWGQDPIPLLSKLPLNKKFQLILLAELLWKDTYVFHFDLLSSIKSCLEPTDPDNPIDGGVALVSFAHRPTTNPPPFIPFNIDFESHPEFEYKPESIPDLDSMIGVGFGRRTVDIHKNKSHPAHTAHSPEDDLRFLSMAQSPEFSFEVEKILIDSSYFDVDEEEEDDGGGIFYPRGSEMGFAGTDRAHTPNSRRKNESRERERERDRRRDGRTGKQRVDIDPHGKPRKRKITQRSLPLDKLNDCIIACVIRLQHEHRFDSIGFLWSPLCGDSINCVNNFLLGSVLERIELLFKEEKPGANEPCHVKCLKFIGMPFLRCTLPIFAAIVLITRILLIILPLLWFSFNLLWFLLNLSWFSLNKLYCYISNMRAIYPEPKQTTMVKPTPPTLPIQNKPHIQDPEYLPLGGGASDPEYAPSTPPTTITTTTQPQEIQLLPPASPSQTQTQEPQMVYSNARTTTVSCSTYLSQPAQSQFQPMQAWQPQLMTQVDEQEMFQVLPPPNQVCSSV